MRRGIANGSMEKMGIRNLKGHSKTLKCVERYENQCTRDVSGGIPCPIMLISSDVVLLKADFRNCMVSHASVASPVLDVAEWNLIHQSKEETDLIISY
jgi:hypothetical protein